MVKKTNNKTPVLQYVLQQMKEHLVFLQTSLIFRDTLEVDVIRFPINSLEPWVKVVNRFFLFGTHDHKHEEMSCIMAFKKYSIVVKETKL